MLIEEIVEIKEFRGIKELAEPLLLKKFNVLIGKNNSGKSALLEALFFAGGVHYFEPITRKPVSNFLAERRGGYRRLIYKYSGKATIGVETLKGEPWAYSIDEHGEIKDLIVQEPVPSPKEIAPMIYLPDDTEFSKKINYFLELNEADITKYNIHTKVAETVSNQLDEKFTEIVLKKDGWYLRREDASYIHIDDMGDGVKKAARIMMVAELLKPKLILWDDFDTSLHPSMIKMLLKWLAQGDWQVVIATHSIDVLYYLADLNEELDNFDAQIILLRKDQEDILHHKELNMDELEDLLEGNVDPRMLVDVLKI